MFDAASNYKMPTVPTKGDVKRLSDMLDDKFMHIKMLKDYEEFKKGDIYKVNLEIGGAILNSFAAYRVD